MPRQVLRTPVVVRCRALSCRAYPSTVHSTTTTAASSASAAIRSNRRCRPGPRTARAPRSGNRQRVPAVTSAALARCAAFTPQVVEPFSEDTPGTDVAGQDVQRGPPPVQWALATDSPSSSVARISRTVTAGSASVGVGFAFFDFLAITSSDCATSLPSSSPKLVRPRRVRTSDLRRKHPLLQDTNPRRSTAPARVQPPPCEGDGELSARPRRKPEPLLPSRQTNRRPRPHASVDLAHLGHRPVYGASRPGPSRSHEVRLPLSRCGL